MIYCGCVVVSSWTYVIGWFAGAVYVHNHKAMDSSRETEVLQRVSEEPEPCTECEAWCLPVAVASAE